MNKSLLIIVILVLLWSTQSPLLMSARKSNSFGLRNTAAYALWEGGDIIGETIVLQNVTVLEPLLIKDSNVTFINVTFPEAFMNVKDFVKIVNSTIILHYPIPYVAELHSIAQMMWSENSTMIISEPYYTKQEEEWPGYYGASYYLASFSYIKKTHIIYLEKMHEYAFFQQPSEVFTNNTLEFRKGGPSYFDIQNCTVIIMNHGWDDVYEPGGNTNIRFVAINVSVGDVRYWGNTSFELINSNNYDTMYFTDYTKVKIVNTTGAGPYVFGNAVLNYINSSGPNLAAYGMSQIFIESSKPGWIHVGDEAQLSAKNSELSLNAFDNANVSLHNIRMQFGYIRLFGSVVAELTNVTMHNMAFGNFQVFDNASVWIKNSKIDDIYIFGNAFLRILNSTIKNIYYEVQVEGEAIVDTSLSEPVSGDFYVPNIYIDENSSVENYETGFIHVKPTGNLTIKNSKLMAFQGGVYVYGDAKILNSTINNLLVYGENSLVEVNSSSVNQLYYSVHVNEDTELSAENLTEQAGFVGVEKDASSYVGEFRFGLLHVYGQAKISARNITIESILVSENANVSIQNVRTRSIKVIDSAALCMENIDFDALNWIWPPLPISKVDIFKGASNFFFTQDLEAEVEVSGQGKVNIYGSAGWRSPVVKIFDNAILETNQSLDIIAYGESYAHFQGGGSSFAMLFDRAYVFARNAVLGGVAVFVLDNATYVSYYSYSQDIFFGRRSYTYGNGAVVGFYLELGQNPATYPAGKLGCLNGTVYIVVWGVIKERMLTTISSNSSINRSDELFAYIDSLVLEKIEWSRDTIVWNTTEVSNGEHNVTIAYGRAGEKVIKQAVVEVRNPDTEGPLIGDPIQEPDVNDVMPNQVVRVSVNVTDVISGVKEVILSYSIDKGTAWTNVSMNRMEGNTYSGGIPSFSAGTYVRYKIIAYDNAGNPAVNDNAGQYYVYTIVPEFPFVSLLPVFMLLTLIAFAWAKLTRKKHINSFLNKLP